MRRIGVFLDDFDPVRLDHLNLAYAARQSHDLEKVIFVPLKKKKKRENSRVYARIDQRYRMCTIGLVSAQGLEMVPYDLVYQAESPFALIRKIRRAYTDAKCFFILSSATLLRLFALKQFQSVGDCAFLYFHGKTFSGFDMLEPLLRQGLDAVELTEAGPRPTNGRECRGQIARLIDPPGLDRKVTAYLAQENLYLPDGRKKLQKMLNEHRWQHSLGVQATAIRLALQYQGNILKVSQAALYHDCAKCLSARDMRHIAEAHHLTDNEEVLRSGALLHGPVGAQVAIDTFGIKDPEVLDAIRYHTTGRADMTLTDLIIFVADAIEPNREPYEGLEKMRNAARYSLKAAALESLYATRKYVTSKGKTFHGQGQTTIAWLEGSLSKEEMELIQQF